ncbi:MAG TPA: XrtA system polysaccharide deacetylase [Terriglobales bacterium]|nr:XrtA system polysaccharide deacetylase [Terriglobales bacterium]
MKNALTFDVEEYFQVIAFAASIDRRDWDTKESRVERTTEIVLEMLGEMGTKATFFTLGWVAEKRPGLVRRIAEAGHEVACHSNLHRQVFTLSPTEFREDSGRAKQLLEDACGQQILGFRAPSFSIRRDSWWALDVLAELGFAYDSSVFPVSHPNYGVPNEQLRPFVVNTAHGPIVEFPMTAIEFAGMRAPVAGGAYFRLLPYWFTRDTLKLVNEQSRSFCTYLHPWEFDPEQPRVSAGLTSRIRHYIGLKGVQRKLKQLLKDFEFAPMAQLVEPLVLSSRPVSQKAATVSAGKAASFSA